MYQTETMAWSFPERARSRIPPIGQGLAVVAAVIAIAVISCGGIAGYLLSLRIAAWGSQSHAIDVQILAKRQEVQRLRNELDFRSRFPELERWSSPLGLQPADGRQYAQSVHQLDMLAAARRQHIADQLPRVGDDKGYTPQARQQLDGLFSDVAN
ncbi:hypothetical protein [Sphingomonas abietis]|uniref:Cell division protein FtsL n=1 Tax=Sphingomonas abietis TaxID=3012344 RepID=A0ABY7NXD7_9SPHN|nr:hypothetical protein [Sphingomonas abietis]WBO24051.1 hypothetical protein PBT88_08060 [Sphingomonas abietis]